MIILFFVCQVPKNGIFKDMAKDLKAFKIKANGKIFDYRLGRKLDLNDVNKFFSKEFEIEKIWSAPRHVLGVLQKENKKLFLKLAKSEGIGEMTKIDYKWNDVFNKEYPDLPKFKVPKNYKSGLYKQSLRSGDLGKLFYEIMEYFEGEPLCGQYDDPEKITNYIAEIIELSEIVQKIKASNLERNSFVEGETHIEWFVNKAKLWLEGIPGDIIQEYKVEELLSIVEEKSSSLERKTRHGDFAPWHIIKMQNGLGLTDGEHAISDGVEYYDICYFIQRAHSELGGIDVAMSLFDELLKRNYDKNKLKIVLAARAIGGFLDEFLKPTPDYSLKNQFKNWVLSIY